MKSKKLDKILANSIKVSSSSSSIESFKIEKNEFLIFEIINFSNFQILNLPARNGISSFLVLSFPKA